MCYANVHGQEPVSIIARVIDWLTVVSAVLIILIVSGCATTMTPTQKEAAWRIAARNVTVLATAFNPEARLAPATCCSFQEW